MHVTQNYQTGGWDEKRSPDEVVREEARKVMGLDDETDFPSVSQKEAYNKLKTNAGLRKKVNQIYIKTEHRPATDAEFDMVLKRTLGVAQESVKKERRGVSPNPPSVQYGDWRDISWQ